MGKCGVLRDEATCATIWLCVSASFVADYWGMCQVDENSYEVILTGVLRICRRHLTTSYSRLMSFSRLYYNISVYLLKMFSHMYTLSCLSD